jgi:hypothetical protein
MEQTRCYICGRTPEEAMSFLEEHSHLPEIVSGASKKALRPKVQPSEELEVEAQTTSEDPWASGRTVRFTVSVPLCTVCRGLIGKTASTALPERLRAMDAYYLRD